MIYLIPLAAVAGTGLITAGWTISVYNTINVAQNDYEGQLADIQAEYQRRLDIFENLVRSVKSHKDFEKNTLVELTKARSGITNKKPSITNIKKMESMFAAFRMQVEAYPELKSSVHYQQLMDEIRSTEDQILIARGELNNIAEDYNTYIKNFPTVLVAKGLFKAKKFNYFQAEGVTTRAPKIAV